MAGPIINGVDQYERIAEAINEFRGAATPTSLTPEQRSKVQQAVEAFAASGLRRTFDEMAEHLGFVGTEVKRRAKTATVKEIEQWVSEIVRQVQDRLLDEGQFTAATIEARGTRIRDEVAASLVLPERRDFRFEDLSQLPHWRQVARSLAFEESDSARGIPGSLTYIDRLLQFTQGLTDVKGEDGLPLLTDEQRKAINGEPGADPALARFAMDFNSQFRDNLPEFMTLVTSEIGSRGATSNVPVTGRLASLTQSVISEVGVENIDSLPVPQVLIPDKDTASTTRSKAERLGGLADADDLLSQPDAEKIANLYLTEAGYKDFSLKAFKDTAFKEGRSEEEAVRDWNAFDATKIALIRNIQNAASTEGSSAADAAEEGVAGFRQAMEESVDARVGAAEAKKLADLQDDTKGQIAAGREFIRGATGKSADDVSDDRAQALGLRIANGEDIPLAEAYQHLDEAAGRKLRERTAKEVWEEVMKTPFSDLTAQTAIFLEDYIEGGGELTEAHGRIYKTFSDNEKATERSGSLSKSETFAKDKIWEVSGVKWDDLMPEDYAAVLEDIRLGVQITKAYAPYLQDSADRKKAQDEAKDQDKLNVTAQTPVEVERLLEDLGYGKVGSGTPFQDELKKTVVPKVVEAINDAAKASPGEPLDLESIAESVIGGADLEDEFNRAVRVLDENQFPALTPTEATGLAPFAPGAALDAGVTEAPLEAEPAQAFNLQTAGIPPVPNLTNTGIVPFEVLEREKFPLPEAPEFEAAISELAGDDILFQNYLIDQFPSLLPDIKKFAREEGEAREAAAFKKFSVNLPGDPLPFSDRSPQELAKLSPAQVDQLKAQEAQRKAQPLSSTQRNFLFKKATAPQPINATAALQRSVPGLRSRFEETTGFKDRELRRAETVATQRQRDEAETQQRQVRSLRRGGRTRVRGI